MRSHSSDLPFMAMLFLAAFLLARLVIMSGNSSGRASRAGPAVVRSTIFEREFSYTPGDNVPHILEALDPADDPVAFEEDNVAHFNAALQSLGHPPGVIQWESRAARYEHRILQAIFGAIFRDDATETERHRIIHERILRVESSASATAAVAAELARLHTRRARDKVSKRATRRLQGDNTSHSRSGPSPPPPPPPPAGALIARHNYQA